jgi:crotonobetainyl-CoA:carnitine CoA-transferase CaiB-like acyl-CoA transferase
LAADVPHAPVWDYGTLLADPQAAARGMRMTVQDPAGKPVDLIGNPFHIDGAAPVVPRYPPDLGADTATVLSELLGLSPAQVAELRARGVIAGP